MPYSLFLVLVSACKAEGIFGKELSAAGLPAMPVELKVLGALRTLGRGTLHDDMAEITGAVKEIHRTAFLKFIAFVAAHMKNQWINIPCREELERVLSEYSCSGFPGCVDATHIHWARCPAEALNTDTGKEGFPTRVFNVVVTRHGKVYSVSQSQPGSRNDKTVVKFDDFAHRLHTSDVFADLSWSVKTPVGDEKTHKGGYLITDNGYHHWRIFCCPW